VEKKGVLGGSLPDIPDIVVVVVVISMAQPCQVVGLVVVAGGTGA